MKSWQAQGGRLTDANDKLKSKAATGGDGSVADRSPASSGKTPRTARGERTRRKILDAALAHLRVHENRTA